MNTQQAYDIWSEIYDTNINKTRDIEALAFREMLPEGIFDRCLELGCGTGKNTEWLMTKARTIISVDLSEAMLSKAKAKIASDNVNFVQADITHDWDFAPGEVDLITFSLVLEHIEDLDSIFSKAINKLKFGGCIYIGELHPFKQYSGTKARFESENGTQVVPCFNHHVSDFISAATNNGLNIFRLEEYFDNSDRSAIPRILTLLLRKI